MVRELLYRMRTLFRRYSMEADLDAELRAHVEQQAETYVQAGMSREGAARRARLEFGGIEQVKEECRDSWGVRFIAELEQDLRYGLRQLRRNPGFTAVAVLTLALGIGVNTGMFNLVDAMLLRPLPALNPSQLVELYTINPARRSLPYSLFSSQMVNQIGRSKHVFSGISAWESRVVPIEVHGQTFPDGIYMVAGNYFSLLGVRPALGRFIIPEDDAGTAPSRVAVISYRFWQSRYSGKADALGQALKVNGAPYSIIGVAPRGFFGLLTGISVDAWVPLKSTERQALYITARLKRGVSIGQARAQIQTLWPSILAATVPEKLGIKQRDNFLAQRIRVVPAKSGVLAHSLTLFRQPLIFLLTAAGIVLLIACLNLASLMLSRIAAREHEMGVRAALGASRRRLVRQLLTESTLLTGSGTLLAIPLALWMSRSLAAFVWTGVTPLGLDLGLSRHVLEFAALAALLTGALIGFAPAWQTTRHGPSALLQDNPHAIAGRSGRGLGKWLLAIQLSISFVLVVGAGLMTRSLSALLSMNPGFQTEGILDLLLQPKPEGYKDFHPQSYYLQLMQDLAALPGVHSVSLSMLGPVEDFQPREPVSTNASESIASGSVSAVYEAVSPHFFQTLGIALLQGRDFEFNDDAHAPHIAIVSKSLARHLFRGGQAIGKTISVGSSPGQQNLRVVGIVSDANLYNVKVQRPPAVYLPFFQLSHPMAPTVETRCARSPQTIATIARRRIDTLGREYVFRTRTVGYAVRESFVREQTLAILADGFGGLALLIALIGLYGLLSYSVSKRTHEIGIRMALGAERRDVLKMVVGQGLKLALMGVAIGIAGALALTRFLASLLYGVKPTDPLTFIVVSLILIAVALAACYIPARRAAKVDPMVALRYE